MAELSVKNFPDDLHSALKIAAIQSKMPLRDYITKALADSLPASIYPANETEVPRQGRKRA